MAHYQEKSKANLLNESASKNRVGRSWPARRRFITFQHKQQLKRSITPLKNISIFEHKKSQDYPGLILALLFFNLPAAYRPQQRRA